MTTRRIASHLDQGHIVALPTDTIYGIASDARNNKAISKIYEAKQRIVDKPLAVCFPNIHTIMQCVNTTLTYDDIAQFLPGPFTLIFNRIWSNGIISDQLNSNTNTIGVRIPDHRVISTLMRWINYPIALTSANLSGHPSPLSINDFYEIHENIDYIYDIGTLPGNNKGSTIIDLTKPGYYKIIRDGCALDKAVEILSRINIVKQ